MSKSCSELLQSIQPLIESTCGDLTVPIADVTAVELASSQSLVFASTKDLLAQALSGPAAVIVTTKALWSDDVDSSKAIVLCRNVALAQAKVTERFAGRWPPRPGTVHPTAYVDPSARLGAHVTVGAFAFVGHDCVVGDRAYIGPQCVIEAGSTIGADTALWGHVYIGARCRVGKESVIHPQAVIGAEGFGFAHDERGQHHRIPQQGSVVIEDRVEIGSHCTVDRATFGDTRIGEGTKLDSHIHVAHNCSIGKHSVLTAGTVMGGSSHVGDHVVMGGNVTITDHVRISDHVHLGGLSGVTKDIERPGAYGGYPLQPMKDYLRTTATLVRLVDIRKNLQRLLKSKTQDY